MIVVKVKLIISIKGTIKYFHCKTHKRDVLDFFLPVNYFETTWAVTVCAMTVTRTVGCIYQRNL